MGRRFFRDVVKGIDFDLLHQQVNAMYELSQDLSNQSIRRSGEDKDRAVNHLEAVEGLLTLAESLLDAAEAEGVFIFPEENDDAKV